MLHELSQSTVRRLGRRALHQGVAGAVVLALSLIMTASLPAASVASGPPMSCRMSVDDGSARPSLLDLDIFSFKMGFRSPPGPPGPPRPPTVSDLTVTKPIDGASADLMRLCCHGMSIPSTVLTCRKAGEKQVEYLKISMAEVVINSYQIQGASGDTLPSETLSLEFTEIHFDYKPQKKDGEGAASVGWDCAGFPECTRMP